MMKTLFYPLVLLITVLSTTTTSFKTTTIRTVVLQPSTTTRLQYSQQQQQPFESRTTISKVAAILQPSQQDATDCNNRNIIKDNQLFKILLSCMIVFAISVSSPYMAVADGQTKDFKFPPIDYTDSNRCKLSSGSSMGQANAARDKLYDLRQCQLSGVDATGYDLSGVIMSGTNLSKANLKEAQFSKGFLQASNFEGADFSNAIVDRANFEGSSLRGALFNNAVLTGTSFANANVENVDFTEAAIGTFDVRNLCKNPTLKGVNPITGADTRLSVGCD